MEQEPEDSNKGKPEGAGVKEFLHREISEGYEAVSSRWDACKEQGGEESMHTRLRGRKSRKDVGKQPKHSGYPDEC